MGLVAIGAARIVATYAELSETVDEVAHVGAGLEWLGAGRYTFELQHPPLARVAAAAGPYLLGVRFQHEMNLWAEGRRALYTDGAYRRNLTAARLGILPFFALAAFFLWRIACVTFGPRAALGGVACFTLLPPILAHFGLATTDAPMFALFAASVYAMMRWLSEPNVATGAGLGIAVGLTTVTKFSAIPYLGVTAVLLLVAFVGLDWRRMVPVRGEAVPAATPGRREASWSWIGAAGSLAIAAILGFVVAWAMFRFSIGTLRGYHLPLTEIPKGIREVLEHNRAGHPAYFLGEVRVRGVWYFFPVMLLLKTPVAALALGVVGFGVLFSRGLKTRNWRQVVPIAVSAAVLGVSLPSGINIGVRHVLPFYLGLALAAGVGWESLWTRLTSRRARVGLVAATALVSVDTVTVHPDYLAYFNVVAGRDPSRLVADSDLDWGQDMLRLRREVERRGVDTLKFAYIGTADLSPIIGVPVKFWDGTGRPNGWIAISETFYRRGHISVPHGRYVIAPTAFWWLDSTSTFTRVGKGIRLYHIPDAASAPRPPS